MEFGTDRDEPLSLRVRVGASQGKITNVTRLRDLCVEDARHIYALLPRAFLV